MKKIICLILSILLLINVPIETLAHIGSEHNKELCTIIFGKSNPTSLLSKDGKKARKALQSAAYLTIDQFGKNGVNDLKVLKRYRVSGLPKSVKKIAISQVNGHRKYTHMGWNHSYTDPDVMNLWVKRKRILLSTVEKIFNLTVGPQFILGYEREFDPRCDGFAALVYYIHILGDYEETTGKYLEKYKEGKKTINDIAADLKKYSDMISFINEYSYKKNEDERSDIFSELKYYIPIICPSSNTKTIIKKISDEERVTRDLYKNINTDTFNEKELEEYHEHIINLLEILKKDMPDLLKKEEYFKKAFFKQ